MRSDIAAAFAVIALLAGCGGHPPATTSSPTPTSTTASSSTAGPRVIFPDGYVVRTEVASDDETRQQGLMYRDRMPDATGMIFIFPQVGDYPFWMKNTLIALDMIWIDEHGRIAHITHDVPPCKADPCPNYGSTSIPSRYVLETAAGVAKKHNVAAGSVLRFEGLENVIVR
jgi:uncharacterized membrane protein (UPF0127 family)